VLRIRSRGHEDDLDARRTAGLVYATKRGYGIRWRDAAGAQHRRAGFETKRDARRWLRDHLDAGIRPDRLTFAELVDAYLTAR
jgi:hypothetical protein